MAQHGALATLKDLAEKEVDDAAVLLGEMRRGCQQAEEQLKMLIDYQHEYRNNLNNDMGQGITSNRWINYQQFIQTLEKAIEQHRQQLNQWTQRVDQALNLNSWRDKKQRLQAWQTLQDRQTSAALLAENRLDQKKMDEFAQRAAMRKPE
ncbi:MAG: flagellar export protein FliJ [Citrobacter freundii]|nr:flagellar export protein FliJ [Citrobacter freundii]